VDQEFRDLAVEREAYHECPEIVQYHRHWGREGEVDNLPTARRDAIKAQRLADKALYERRKRRRTIDPRLAPDPITGGLFAAVFANAKHNGFGISGRFAYCRTQDIPKYETHILASEADTLILHNSDRSFTGEAPPNIHNVCAVNCACETALPLPLGLINSRDIHDTLEQTEDRTCDVLCYLNAPYNVPNAAKRAERSALYGTIANESWCHAVNADGERGLTFEAYYTDLARSMYCLSPRGAGIDCHRTWEALYLGCIPIVRRHDELTAFSMDTDDTRVFRKGDGLPIMVVDDWAEVTRDRLESEWGRYAAALARTRAYLTFEYWKTKVQAWIK
jgi:hypothetical protein